MRTLETRTKTQQEEFSCREHTQGRRRNCNSKKDEGYSPDDLCVLCRSASSRALLVMVLSLLPMAAASQYTAQIRQEHWAFQAGPGNEWEGELFADLFENGILIPDDPSFTYRWFRAFPGGPFQEFDSRHHIPREGINAGSYRDFYVEIYRDGVRLALSETLRVRAPSSRKQVTVYLQREDGSSGYVEKIDFWSFPRNWHPTKGASNGGVLPLRRDETETLRARSDILSPPEVRFRRWTRDDGAPSYRNHDQFEISLTTNSITAHYRAFVSDVVITTCLIDDSRRTDGLLDYKDPWLRDTTDEQFYNYPYGYRNLGMNAPFKPVSSPFTPARDSKYRGVFLNQRYDVPNPVYYSVGAPSVNTIGNFVSYFQNWDNSNPAQVEFQNPNAAQTGVVFKVASATATAKYKGKLLSSLSNATASNSQRIGVSKPYAPGGENLYALAYPSAGELWWNVSYDDGRTWWYDTRFTSTSGTASAPSVALWAECLGQGDDPCRTELYAVYRQQSGGTYRIMFTNPPFPEPGVNPPTQLNSSAIPTTIDTRPVITRVDFGGNHELFALWEGSDGLMLNSAYLLNGQWVWAGEQQLVPPPAKRPSVSGVSTTDFFLTYDNTKTVKVLDYQGYVNEPVPASIAPTSYASQVSADTRNDPADAYIVWEALADDETGTNRGTMWEETKQQSPLLVLQRRVMFQAWEGATQRWTAAHEFRSANPTVHYYRPTVSNLSSGTVVWAWDDGSTTFKAEANVLAGEDWVVTETQQETIFPNLFLHGSFGPITTTRFVGTTASGPPYALSLGNQTGQHMRTSVVPEQYSRRVVVARRPVHVKRPLRNGSAEGESPTEDSTSYFSVEVSSVRLKLADGSWQSLPFAAVPESTSNPQAIWLALRTQVRALPAECDSVVIEADVAIQGASRFVTGDIGLSFDVVDADHGTVLKKVGKERLYRTNGRGTLVLRDRLRDLAGRRVVLKPTVRGINALPSNLAATVVHVHTLLDEQPASPAVIKRDSMLHMQKSITQYALHPNTPNPFNPSTTINYDLPEPSHVSLVIYDVLGRKVAEVVNGVQEAGFKSVVWDASGVASGVYFARFTATDAHGSVKLARVMKLVLAK